MKRFLLLLAGLLAFAEPAFATSLTLTGGGGVAAAGGGYTGPGDIVGSAKAFYGLRAYSAAVAATGTQKAVNVARSSDSQTCDILINTSGDLGNTANCSGAANGTAAATFCNATTCRIGTWYDQVGGFNASAGAGFGPVLTFSCVGGKPCAVFSGANFLEASTATSTNQPLTVSAVAIRTGGTGQSDILSGANGAFFSGAFNSGNATGYFGASPTVTETDNAWHAMQFVVSGGTPGVSVDGTFTGGSFGAGALSSDYFLGAQSTTPTSPLTGKIAEAGLWPVAFTGTQQTNVCHNQFTYFGTSTSC